MRCSVLRTVAVVTALLAGRNALAQQELASNIPDRGPRFLLAQAPASVPIDVSRTPVLRSRISLALDDVTLKQALAAISEEAGLDLAYSVETVPVAAHVRLRAEDITVAAALTDVLIDAGANVDVVFNRNGRATLVPRARSALLPPVGSITGVVTEVKTQQPLVAVTVQVEGTHLGALTDDNGRYRITEVPAGAHTVTARRIGYARLSQAVTVVDGQEAHLDFALEPTANVLDQVVVTATGNERRKEIGNAVSTIDSASLARAPVNDLQDILTGRTSGVTVMQNSGQPGAGGTIRLRGINSISQGNSPIIYVDGIRIYNGNTGTTTTGRQTTLPLNDIDAADIDHVEIVKGPAATTLYGTQASGGVIQIFTKHGTAGRAQWNGMVTGGFNNMGHVGPSSDPTGMFLNDCAGVLTNGVGKTFEDPSCPASGSWLSNGPVQQYSASVRGGTKDMTYYLSGDYNREKGVLPSGGDRSGGGRGNFTFTPTRGLTLGLNASYTANQVDWVPDGNQAQGALLNISRGPNSSFTIGTGCSPDASVCLDNAELFEATSFTHDNHYINGLSASYDPGGHFSTRLNFGYDYDDYVLQTEFPFGFLPAYPQGQLDQEVRNRKLITTDFAANWRQGLGADFQTTTSVGGQMFDSRYLSNDLQTKNFAGPGVPIPTSGALTAITGAENERVINAGFFVQELVGWRDRVFVTGGLRVDGNSAFGSSFGLQTYPKISVAYVISDESWWHVPFIESLKLRGALGESGKAPGAFDAVRTWSPIAAENGQPAFTPDQIGNPDLGPERTRETEAGFDLTTTDGWATLSATYYSQHTMGALIPVTLPPSNGFTDTQLENVGDLYNKGIELSFGADVLRLHDLTWNARLNYTWVKSKAGDLGGQIIPIEPLSRTYVEEGYPVPSYFGYKVTNPNAFADPIVDSSAYLGATYPNQIISPSMTVTLWKNLSLDAIGEWQLGAHLLNATAYQNAYLGVWQPCYAVQDKLRAAAAGDPDALDDVTALQRARCTIDGSKRDYAYWVEPSNFFKLRSVTLTYALPARLTPFGMHDASISVAGRNLWTSTKFTGTDPEVADIATNTFSRRDYYVFPSYRTFTATLRFGF